MSVFRWLLDPIDGKGDLTALVFFTTASICLCVDFVYENRSNNIKHEMPMTTKQDCNDLIKRIEVLEWQVKEQQK